MRYIDWQVRHHHGHPTLWYAARRTSDVRGAILEKYGEGRSQLTVQVEHNKQVIDLKLD